MSDSFTRRQFLNSVGATGGSAAVYQMSMALGLLPGSAQAVPFAKVEALGNSQRSVLILGAGIAGLVCAYELERAGFGVTILEASHRIGGRNLTIRSGDFVDEMGHPQTCQFDRHPNLYFNAGPARIPSHHHHLLHYCRTLGVELEMFVNDNKHTYVHDPKAFGGKPIKNREYVTDARGFMTELLAKAVNKPDFEKAFSGEDTERVLEFLRSYGDLSPANTYEGSLRAGYKSNGMVIPGELKTPVEFSDLLDSSFWRFRMHFTEGEDQCSPLMQAVGGMDNIVKAFVRNIKSRILTNAQVKRITLGENGVDVVYQHKGRHKTTYGDYCLNSIPKHLMGGIDSNLPNDYSTALASIGRGKLFKMGIQMRERFWEKENIYGGITWTEQEIEQLWYPPHGIHTEKGVMLGAYTFDAENSEFFARMTPEQRFEEVLKQGEKIHPDFRKYAQNAVSVPWHRMNHMMGCTAVWTAETRERWFKRLQQPEGRHYMIGDQMSFHPGWQEGAMSSAHWTLAHLNNRVRAELSGAAVNA